MRVGTVLLLAILLTGCAAPSPSPAPTSGESTVTIDCGPYAGDFADCLAIIGAAAKIADPTPVPGTRIEVSRASVGEACPTANGCVQLAAATTGAHVKFSAPNGAWASADVITNPLGLYVGVNPAYGN